MQHLLHLVWSFSGWKFTLSTDQQVAVIAPDVNPNSDEHHNNKTYEIQNVPS